MALRDARRGRDGGEGGASLRRVLPALPLLALAAAGCLSPAGAGGWTLSGSYAEEATQEDVAEFGRAMRERFGADRVLALESFPPQFQVLGLAREACRDARAFAQDQPFVARVDECREATRTTSPGETTSTTPGRIPSPRPP